MKKRYREAIDDYNKAIELNPRHASAYCSRGIIQFNNFKDTKRALEDFAIEFERRIKLRRTLIGLISPLARLFLKIRSPYYWKNKRENEDVFLPKPSMEAKD